MATNAETVRPAQLTLVEAVAVEFQAANLGTFASLAFRIHGALFEFGCFWEDVSALS